MADDGKTTPTLSDSEIAEELGKQAEDSGDGATGLPEMPTLKPAPGVVTEIKNQNGKSSFTKQVMVQVHTGHGAIPKSESAKERIRTIHLQDKLPNNRFVPVELYMAEKAENRNLRDLLAISESLMQDYKETVAKSLASEQNLRQRVMQPRVREILHSTAIDPSDRVTGLSRGQGKLKSVGNYNPYKVDHRKNQSKTEVKGATKVDKDRGSVDCGEEVILGEIRENPNLKNSRKLNESVVNLENESGNLNFSNDLEYNQSEADSSLHMQSTLNRVDKTLREISRRKVGIERYKLTKEKEFRLWFAQLKNELFLEGLSDVIDSDVVSDVEFSLEERAVRETQVKAIIIGRIDDYHHNLVLNMNDPRRMIACLKNQRALMKNMSDTTVRNELRKMKMNQNESVADYIQRFESVVREYNELENTDNLTFNYKTLNEKEMSYQKLKTTMIQVEADNREFRTNQGQIRSNQNQQQRGQGGNNQRVYNVAARMATQQLANLNWTAAYNPALKDKKCHRCFRRGQYKDECLLKPLNLHFCGTCNTIDNHIARMCPNPKYEYLSNMNKNNDLSGNFLNRGGGGDKVTRGRSNRSSRRNGRPYSHGPSANFANQVRENFIPDNKITFIADSGVSEHIVGKGLVLKNFRKCLKGVIKSANKNQMADIKINGKGDLILNSESGEGVILTNVLLAHGISGNLLSLNKFADVGLTIHLDNKKIRIFDKKSDVNYLTGVHRKPNWLVNFYGIKSEGMDESHDYECTARLVSVSELSEQSQTTIDGLSTSEGVTDKSELNPSVIGREKDTGVADDVSSESEFFIDADMDSDKLRRVIHEMSESNGCFESGADVSVKSGHKNRSLDKLTEGMKWHRRLGHVSRVSA